MMQGCFIKNDLMKASHEHILQKVRDMNSTLFYLKDSTGVLITSQKMLPNMIEINNQYPIVTAKAIHSACL